MLFSIRGRVPLSPSNLSYLDALKLRASEVGLTVRSVPRYPATKDPTLLYFLKNPEAAFPDFAAALHGGDFRKAGDAVQKAVEADDLDWPPNAVSPIVLDYILPAEERPDMTSWDYYYFVEGSYEYTRDPDMPDSPDAIAVDFATQAAVSFGLIPGAPDAPLTREQRLSFFRVNPAVTAEEVTRHLYPPPSNPATARIAIANLFQEGLLVKARRRDVPRMGYSLKEGVL